MLITTLHLEWAREKYFDWIFNNMAVILHTRPINAFSGDKLYVFTNMIKHVSYGSTDMSSLIREKN